MIMKWPSSQVRETFINYFLRHSSLPHIHVPSTSIIPRNDPSLAFVNAGMNQFKDIILGLGRPPNARVTNSQKCLRINDLSLVGVDTYHHTFFEMLGNWSFANYFKAEACQMAWDLLTNVYKLDPNRLYVTFYAGGNSIPVDDETKRIWESIGISKDRIIPFGVENFWAMGPIGPCGPSTEIHYDHRGIISDPKEVNKESGNVVEIWNLVFMQYNRTENGTLERLPLSHVVDTGAGLERLTAVLNEKVSNYDTDLFIPIFDSLQNMSKVAKYSGNFQQDAELDKSYRLYADHIRAITVALSDGILPQTNHKIRKLIQRSLSVTEKQFIPHLKSSRDLSSFLNESVNSVVSTLSKVYPQMEQMKSEIGEILAFEVDRSLDANKNNINVSDLIPNLLVMDFPSLGRIKKSDLEKVKAAGILDGPQAFKWYDALGVTQEAAEELCQSLNIKFDKEGMNEEMKRVKKGFRDEIAKQVLLNSETNFIRKVESFLSKYKPEYAGGICKPELTINDQEDPIFVEWIFDQDGEPVEEFTGSNKSFWVILSKTIFIPGSHAVSSDVGAVVLKDGSTLNITNVKMLPSGWILHLVSNAPILGFKNKAQIHRFESDNAKVFGREISAQAIRYLQHWLFKHFKVIRFTGGFVSDQEVRLEFTILNGELGSKEIRQLQEDLNQYGIPLVVTKRINKKNGEYELICNTGISAEITNRHGFEATELLNNLEKLCNSHNLSDEIVQEEIKSICQELSRCLKDKEIIFPFDVYKIIEEGLEKAEKLVQKSEEGEEIKRVTKELEGIQEPFVLKCFESDNEFSSLKKVTRVVESKPVLVLVMSSDGYVQGRCSIPESLTKVSDSLSAKDWMTCITKELGTGTVNPPKGQNPELVANLKRVRVHDAKTKINFALEKAEEYIINNCCYVKVLEDDETRRSNNKSESVSAVKSK